MKTKFNISRSFSSNPVNSHVNDKRENLLYHAPGNRTFHRCFGKWKCGRSAKSKKCKNTWVSAYTWISLEHYLKNSPPLELVYEKDFIGQDCRVCNSRKNIITEFTPLEWGDGETLNPHKSELCAKCQSGAFCQYYSGYES